MSFLSEQLKALPVTDTLQHSEIPASFTKLPWATGTGSISITGWKPPGFEAGKPAGSAGGLYYNTAKVTGGNGATIFQRGADFGELNERQFSVWLFANIADSSPDGYQLCVYQEGANDTYTFKLRKWIAGAETLLGETKGVTVKANGAFAVVRYEGKVSCWVRETVSAEWVLVGSEVTDSKWTEGHSGIDGNGSNPTLLNFATGKLTVKGKPSATTEDATSVTAKAATLNGTVNPNGVATTVWFEYGKTVAYGSETAHVAIGTSPITGGLPAKELAPGTTYHFRVVATNAEGTTNGEDKTFTTLTPPKTVRKRRKPPLHLDVEVETPSGTFRLPADARMARNKPRGLSFNTQRGDGFGPGGVTLSREIFRDYPDIGLLDTWRFISHSGEIVYEGRLHSNPRTNDPEEQIDAALVGWMTYLKGRKINPIIIDRLLSAWGEGSKQQISQWLTEGRKVFSPQTLNLDNGTPVIRLSVQEPYPTGARCGALYSAPSSDIGTLKYNRTKDAGDNISWATYLMGTDEFASIVAGNSGTIDTPVSGGSLSGAGAHYAWLELAQDTAAVSGNETSDSYSALRVLGTHGLTSVVDNEGKEAFQLTDILQWLLAAYYPKIQWAGEANLFPVTQASWNNTPASGYEILQQLNNLVLWETNVWAERKLYFHGADLTTIDWQFKTTDPGVTVLFQGDSIEEFANGVSVSFTDYAGRVQALYPADFAELRDENDANPANRHGEYLWTDCTVPYPCSLAEALQFGRIYLAEFNRPKRPGTYRVDGGYIKDAAGQWRQGWAVHNSETLGIMDHPDDSPRLITATAWDDDSKSLQITVDAPDKMLDAVVARHELARESNNLS